MKNKTKGRKYIAALKQQIKLKLHILAKKNILYDLEKIIFYLFVKHVYRYTFCLAMNRELT